MPARSAEPGDGRMQQSLAIYSAAHERYQEATLLTGHTACTVHLAAIDD
jgi:hypothetical protein